MQSCLRWFRATYLTVDLRSLGAFRIGFGLVLLFDLARRYQDLPYWYTNAGLLPNHTLLWRPPAGHMFSLFFLASSEAEARVGFALCAGVYLLFLLGYRTRFMQLAALVCRVSLNSRLAVLENGGDMVINLLCLFTLALPLGRRFSLDALLSAPRRSLAAEASRTDDPPFASLAMLGLTLQFAAIYFFNAVSKQGETWTGGFAVHYALHQDKLVTDLGVWMREQLPLEAIAGLTWGTLAVEWLGFVLIVSPVFVRHARLLAVCMLPTLHLGFALGLHLGAFSPAMMSFFPLLLRREHWDAMATALGHRVAPLAAALERRRQRWLPAAAVAPERETRGARWLAEAFVFVLMLAIASEVVNDNASVPEALRVEQPAWAKALIEYPRLLQGWRMFAPDPSTHDTMIHVDAVTAEGAHVDPFNAVASREPFPAGEVVPARMDQDQFFTMYSDRIGNVGYAAYRQAFQEWLLAYPERTGRAHDCLMRFDVYLITDESPAPGTRGGPTPVSRKRFMTYQAPPGSECRSRFAAEARLAASARR